MATNGWSKPAPPLWAVPVSKRPRQPLSQLVSVALPAVLAFVIVFNLGILLTALLLLLLYPLSRLDATRRRYRQWGKSAFGRLLVLIVQYWSPTELVLTAGEGVPIDTWIERNAEGAVTNLRLPDKALWMSNHTTLLDWIYIWGLAYLSRDHSSTLFISLKSSIRKVPVIGWAADQFGFVFLERNWSADKEPFAKQLHAIAAENRSPGEQMAVLLFPEGTIVTDDTRQKSRSFAEKSKQDDCKHLLLPRSTGLFFALRQLALDSPTVQLVDITLAYPVPRSASAGPDPPYASEYYTLPSVLLSRVPPPELHVHVRAFKLDAIPLGRVESDPDRAGVVDATDAEKKTFGRWLRERWAEKDEMIERFRREGSLVPRQWEREAPTKQDEEDDDDEDDQKPRWPVALREPAWEVPAAFQFGWPLVVTVLLWTRQVRPLLALLYSAFAGRRGAPTGANMEAKLEL